MQDLTKRRAYLGLKPGDPWTFLELPEGAKIGDVVAHKWPDDFARAFRITAVHQAAIETVYVGPQEENVAD